MSEWRLEYRDYVPEQQGLRESLCALGNGYFVTRAAATDVAAGEVHYPGTYVAGAYNRLTSRVQGREIENESLVNCPNWLPLAIRIEDGDWLHPDHCEVLDYRQELDIARGLLVRRFWYRDGEGRVTACRERRLVSMAACHLAATELTVTPENWSGSLSIRSAIDGGVTNRGVARYQDLNGQHLVTVEADQPGEDTVRLRSRTVQSRWEIALAARTQVCSDGGQMQVERSTALTADQASQTLNIDVSQGQAVAVEKVVGLYTSRDHAVSEAGLEAAKAVAHAGHFRVLEEAQELAWRHLWQECNVEIETVHDRDARLKLRLQIFHLLQTASYHSVDLDAGIPPRGWHGEAYRGHIMWDELFVFPFLNLRIPLVSRALMRYRYRRLPEARRAAARAGHAGAMFPWQSGSDGREESQEWHLNPLSGRWVPDNSHRQRHISADIAYNVWQHYQVTGDREFLYYYGAPLLVDTARFWTSLAEYNPERGRYEIRGVMGPDEFHTAYPGRDPSTQGGLNNNAYTNVMVAWSMLRVMDTLDLLSEDRRQQVTEALEVTAEELELWDEISSRLYVPFHDDGIISQFEGYEALEEFDWEGYRQRYGDLQRLDRILEKEGESPNRYRISKQADVLMLFYLFSADELRLLFERLGYPFGRDTIPRNVEYYHGRTSHGSTLSWVVHAWVLARADRAGAWELFSKALNSDFTDIQGGTTPEGVHLGAMAGTVDLVQRCFVGLETRDDVLHLDPVLPAGMSRIRTSIRYRGHRLDIEVDAGRLTVASRHATAQPITVSYRGHSRPVSPGDRYTFRLVRAPAR